MLKHAITNFPKDKLPSKILMLSNTILTLRMDFEATLSPLLTLKSSILVFKKHRTSTPRHLVPELAKQESTLSPFLIF